MAKNKKNSKKTVNKKVNIVAEYYGKLDLWTLITGKVDEKIDKKTKTYNELVNALNQPKKRAQEIKKYIEKLKTSEGLSDDEKETHPLCASINYFLTIMEHRHTRGVVVKQAIEELRNDLGQTVCLCFAKDTKKVKIPRALDEYITEVKNLDTIHYLFAFGTKKFTKELETLLEIFAFLDLEKDLKDYTNQFGEDYIKKLKNSDLGLSDNKIKDKYEEFLKCVEDNLARYKYKADELKEYVDTNKDKLETFRNEVDNQPHLKKKDKEKIKAYLDEILSDRADFDKIFKPASNIDDVIKNAKYGEKETEKESEKKSDSVKYGFRNLGLIRKGLVAVALLLMSTSLFGDQHPDKFLKKQQTYRLEQQLIEKIDEFDWLSYRKGILTLTDVYDRTIEFYVDDNAMLKETTENISRSPLYTFLNLSLVNKNYKIKKISKEEK